jgi:hypothetical protein
MSSLVRRFLLAGALVGPASAGLGALPAAAQDVPSYAQPPGGDETIRGRIVAVDGAFRISVRDVRGFIDQVQLQGGTIINPRGLALAPGMDVAIVGFNAGAYFQANEIDTPFSYQGDLPPPVYYGPGWWYPGFAYGYGPAFSLGFVAGSPRPYFVYRRFSGHPWSAGYRPPPIGARRAPTAYAARPGTIRRAFGASDGSRIGMDQVYSGGTAPHRAQPEVYEVARSAHPSSVARAPSASSRH